MKTRYDAVLLVSFGGPEGPDEVLPFLENVLRGRNVPRERMLEVAEHYQHFGGVSPINAQNRALIAALVAELNVHGPPLPVYWGNRNWHPLLEDTLRQMADDGIERALAFVTSAFSSYSGCRQYRENIVDAQATVGDSAPQVDKLRVFFNHPGFIESMAERVGDALARLEGSRDQLRTLFTAHSIPLGMAETCQYQAQLEESCRLVAQHAGIADWQLVYQSRSGPPSQPWLEPDVCDTIRAIGQGGGGDVLLAPIGFISDHMEVLFDLDVEAVQVAEEVGVNLLRAETVGTHPKFVGMIRELIVERVEGHSQRLALGDLGPSHDECSADCCIYTPRRPQ